MQLEEIVNSHYDSLNENDLYIWQYIYHHKRECQKMSIQELARTCNVSHTSIIRFTKKLGLDGYSELKVYLKWGLEKKTHFDNSIISNAARQLQDTISMMEEKDFDGVLSLIYGAKRIFVYGTGQVQDHVAMEFKRQFAYRRKIMHMIEGYSEIDTTLHYVNTEDIFILISLSGDNETVVTLAKTLHRLQIKSIGIALDTNNLLSKYCNEFIGFNASSFSTGYFDIQYNCTAHFFLIVDMLFLRYLEYCDAIEQ